MKRSVLLILLFVLAGCATPKFIVTVNSINSGNLIKERRYIILPGMKDVNANDLQFQEYTTYIKRALVSRGFNVVDQLNDANIVIFLAYGIGDPKEHSYIYSIPIVGQTGVSSATTYGNVHSFGNTATYSGITTYTPTYGVVGSTTHQGYFVTYFRHLILDAYDLEKKIELWKTEVTSEGSSGDLRQVFPALVVASTPYISENTKQKVTIELREDDERILSIKGITKDKKK